MSPLAGSRRVFEPLAGGGYALDLIDDGVRVDVRHLRREWRQLWGEVDVRCQWAGASTFDGSLTCADLNLSSQKERAARADYCAKRAETKPDAFDWHGVLDEVCLRIITAERNGTDAIVLDDAPDDGPPRDFVVHGLSIPADSHSQFIADGGGLKSILLMLVLGEMAKQGIPVAYLDWEWNAARHLARKRRLLGEERLEALHYLQCRNSLVVEHDHIRRFCDQAGIQFIAIDSIGAACDGKLADDDVARAYNRALSDLPPSLAAAHVPKAVVDPAADLKAFGSAFFHNFARMTWTVKKQVGDQDDVATVLLVPHKQNDGTRARPVAVEFTFTTERIDVRSVEPSTVESFASSLPIWQRMKTALTHGPRTLAALSDELGAKTDSLDREVRRKNGMFTKVAGKDGITRIALVETRVA